MSLIEDDVDSDVDVDVNLVNTSALTDLFKRICKTVNKQNDKINKLEAEIRQIRDKHNQEKNEKTNVFSSVSSLSDRVLSLEKLCSSLSSSLRSSVLPSLPDLLSSLRTRIDKKVSKTAFHAFVNEYTANTANITQSLAQKTEKNQLELIAQSVEGIHEELTQIQQTLTTKIDRSAMPLLNSTQATLHAFDVELSDTKSVLSRLSSDLSSLRSVVSSKESSEAVITRMQSIHLHLTRKVDLDHMTKLNEDIDRIKRAITAQEEQMNDKNNTIVQQREDFKQIVKQIQDMRQQLQKEEESTTKINETIDKLNQQASECMSRSSCTSSLHDLRRSLQENLKQHQAKTMHDLRVQGAYVSDLRQEIAQQQNAVTALQASLAVCRKFIDWYTQVKLND